MDEIINRIMLGTMLVLTSVLILGIFGFFLWFIGWWSLIIPPAALGGYLIGTLALEGKDAKKQMQKDLNKFKNLFNKAV